MDKRVSTALIAVRDTLVALLISLPAVLALRLLIAILRLPERPPEVNAVEYLLGTAGWLLPLALAASSLGFLAAGWWFRAHRPVDGWDPPYWRELSWEGAVAIGVGVGFLDLVLSAIVGTTTALVFGLERIESAEMIALAGARGGLLAVIVVLVTLVGPVGEELFFRGHLFRWSAGRCGLPYAYALTAVIFALAHFNPPAIPVYLVTALLLGWSYQRWRTLTVPIVAHATKNAVAITAFIAVSRTASGG